MFERTLEAQALDAPHANLSPFSIALLVHAAAAGLAVVVSLLVVPAVIGPEPPRGDLVVLLPEPVELKREAPKAAEAPKKGTDNPGATLPQPLEEPPPEAPPSETPEDLPPAVPEPLGDPGEGRGTAGVEDGSDLGVEDGFGPGGGGGPGDGEGGGPVDLTPDMVPPVLLEKVSPVYPNAARVGRIQGQVVVEAVIGLDGRVGSVEVLASNPLFDAAAVAAVRQWRYRPATMNGRPVRVYFKVQVGFVLR